ncbi:MAG: hypothetical protein F2599_03500 [Actinobacteria bacterium]|uniref:Unannotated protein n=1 Tax=freshwater metagenome TaxID=449393 RepID=A0A6J6I7H8_9ZZZZ|nr:hypothetical protein [Actinomycetota bacterium]
MANFRTINSYLGLALMLALISAAPTPSWASCKNSGGSAGLSKVSSEVAGGSVKICALASSVSPARVAVLIKPIKIVVKAPIKVVVVPPKPIIRVAPHQVQILFGPQYPFPKPETKTRTKLITKIGLEKKPVTSPGLSLSSSDAAIFTPAELTLSAQPSNQLLLGQRVNFQSSASLHYRTGLVLGLATEVRFTPMKILWQLAQETDSDWQPEHVFDTVGTHSISARVDYEVAYRLRGSSDWVIEPDQISQQADMFVEVSTGNLLEQKDPEPVLGKKVLLVGSACEPKSRVFGCR